MKGAALVRGIQGLGDCKCGQAFVFCGGTAPTPLNGKFRLYYFFNFRSDRHCKWTYRCQRIRNLIVNVKLTSLQA